MYVCSNVVSGFKKKLEVAGAADQCSDFDLELPWPRFSVLFETVFH